MPTTSRTLRSKSRTGCNECKQRRKKCDESKPSCKNCSNRNAECSFVEGASRGVVISSKYDVSSQLDPSQHTSLKSLLLSESTTANDSHLSPGQEIDLAARYALRNDAQDTSRLITHFLLSTCHSISDSPNSAMVWHDIVPAIAFENPFLLSGIYAVTSLHLALLKPCGEHNSAAFWHHSRAFALFRPQLENITPENVDVLFAFSCLIPLYSFGVHNVAPLSDMGPGPLFEINGVFILLRGTALIVKNGMEWLRNGPFRENILLQQPGTSAVPVTEAVDALTTLYNRNTSLSQDSSSREAYTEAIDMLRVTFLLAAERPGSKMAIISFAILAPDEFVQRMKDGEPMALAILAHYAVVLHQLRKHIWLYGWGKKVVLAVRDSIDKEWLGCIEWAVGEVADDPDRVMGPTSLRK